MHRFRSRAAVLGVGALVLVAILIGAGAIIILGAAPEPTPTPSPTASATPTPSPSPTPTPSPSPTPTASPTPSPTPVAVCPMNGQQLADPGLAGRVPILVQIENNPLARPPSGLNLADLVVEAPVEGDTTRFMAVYMCSPSVGAAVGPVRSARYFNVDLWQQLRAVTFNFGGARAVLAASPRQGCRTSTASAAIGRSFTVPDRRVRRTTSSSSPMRHALRWSPAA